MLKELVIDYHYRLPRPDGQSREEAVSLHNLLASNTATHLDRQKITTRLFASEITKSLPNPTTQFPPTTASARGKTGKITGGCTRGNDLQQPLYYTTCAGKVRSGNSEKKKRKERRGVLYIY